MSDLSPRQLRALAGRIRHRAGPLDSSLKVGLYLRAEALHEIARALDELAVDDEAAGR